MAEAAPVGASAPVIRKVGLDRPWAWLAAGWQDLMAAPSVSITYGVVFAVVCFTLVLSATGGREDRLKASVDSALSPLAGTETISIWGSASLPAECSNSVAVVLMASS